MTKERALKVAKIEDRKSTFQDYKIPESFGESLPQCILQTYIVLVKAETLSNIVSYLNSDLATNGLLLSTYFSLFASFLSLSLTTSSMLVEYWHFTSGKVLKPSQGFHLTLKMMILMVPIVFSRIISISFILACPLTWWIKLILILVLLLLYGLGYCLVLLGYKKFNPDNFDGANNFVIFQALTSLMVPCIWINPKLKLLLLVSAMTSFVHLHSLISVLLLTLNKHEPMELYFGLSLVLIFLLSPMLTYIQWKIIRKHNFRSACASGDLPMVHIPPQGGKFGFTACSLWKPERLRDVPTSL